MSALREMLAFFGVEVDDHQLKGADEKMKGLAETAMKAGEIIGIAFGLHEISEFITKQIELGAELLHTSEILGLSVGDLQAFQYAAANAGLGAEEADTALRFLNKNIGEAVKGAGTAGPVFQKFGVKLKDATGEIRPTQDVLADVADGISKMHSPAEKTAAAMEVFGRAGARMIPLLNKGAKGIDELYGEFEQLGGGLSEEFVEAAEKGEHELIKLRTVSKNLVGTVAAELMPAFTGMVSWVTDAVNSFREFAEHSYIVQTALGTLAGVAVVLAAIWGVLNIEILLVVAAIALAILVVDDIYTAFKGGKSVIGDFIDAIGGIGTTKHFFDDVRDWAEEAWLGIRQMINGIKIGINAIRTGYNEVKHVAQYALTGRGDAEYEKTKKEIDADLVPLLDKHDRLSQEGRNDDLHRSDRLNQGGRQYEPSFDVEAPRATVTAPGLAGGPTHNGNIIKENNVQVTVHGSNAKENADLVLGAVSKAIDDDDRQSAFAALPTGGGH